MSDLLKEQEINIDLLEVPVIFKSKKNGNKSYFIREMPAPDLFAFLDANKEITTAVELAGEGNLKVNMQKTAEAIPSLLSHCLFNEEDEAVPIDEIKQYPLRIQQQLMEIAQEVNGLTAKAAEQAGNSQTGSESGTDSPPGSTVQLPSVNEKQESDDSSNG